MAESAARHLRRAGVSDILVTNRTRSRADLLAEEFQGQVVPYEDFVGMLAEIDILLTSSAAPHYGCRRRLQWSSSATHRIFIGSDLGRLR